MSLEPGQQFLADFVLGFIASVFSRWVWARIIACLVIPFAVSFIAMGPGNFGSLADGGGLVYTFFLYFAFYGLIASACGGGLAYLVRRALKLKT